MEAIFFFLRVKEFLLLIGKILADTNPRSKLTATPLNARKGAFQSGGENRYHGRD